jgi:hypothetical protein
VTEPHPVHAADLRAVLLVARDVLNRLPGAAHDDAGTADCPACAVIAAVQLGFTIAAELTSSEFMTGPLRKQLLGFIDATENELRAKPN